MDEDSRATIRSSGVIWRVGAIVRLEAKFRVGDTVRFIGGDASHTVRQYDKSTHEYQVQRGDDDASLLWVLGVYLEHVQIANSQAAD